MTSLNAQANSLLAAYNSAMGQDLAMNPAYERWLVEASNFGLCAEDFSLAIASRLKFNAANAFKKGVLLHYFVMGCDNIGVTISEAAEARARLRVRVVDSAKASVLAATGRPATVPQSEAVRVGDLELIQRLKEAVK